MRRDQVKRTLKQELQQLKEEQAEQDKKIAELEKQLEAEKEVRVPDCVDVICDYSFFDRCALLCGETIVANEKSNYNWSSVAVKNGLKNAKALHSNYILKPVDKPKKGGLYYCSDDSDADFKCSLYYHKYFSKKDYFFNDYNDLEVGRCKYDYYWEVIYSPK